MNDHHHRNLQPAAPHPRGVGFLDVFTRRAQAWIIRRVGEAELTILEARRKVAEATVAAEDAETELQLRRYVRQLPTGQAREILGQELETERLLLEREQVRRQRLGGGSGHGLPALPSGSAPVELDVSDQQVEALAVKAITRFSQLPPEEAERAWSAWQRELELRLPPYAAREVARRAAELRGLLR